MPKKPQPFVEPVFKGPRFQAELPVDVLPDLVAYKDLVLRVAKELYRSRTGRQRVPKGFESSFQLVLAGEIREGSAVVPLWRTGDEDVARQLAVDADGDPFEAARDLVEDYVAAIGSEQKPPKEFPENVIPLFQQFGKHLRDTDELQFVSTRHKEPIRYNQQVRKQIVLTTAATYEKEVELLGHIVELDKEHNVFRLRTEDYGTVNAIPFSPLQGAMLSNALRDDKFTKVEVLALASFDRAETLKGIRDVADITVVDVVDEVQAARITKRLNEFAELNPGWSNEGAGAVPPRDAIDWVREVLLGLMARDNLPAPYLYPTDAGHIRAEWTFGSCEVSAEFNYAVPSATLESVDVETGEFREAVVTFVGQVDEDLAISTFVKDAQEGAAQREH